MIDGFERLPRLADQPFLDHRHLGQRQLDAEVAAGDHDAAARGADDLGRVLGRLALLDLGDHRDVGAERAQPLGDRLEVGRGGDEGQRQQVDAVLDRELDPAQVAVGGGRAGGAGDVHPLVGGQRAADLDLAVDAVLLALVDPQADRAVGEVDELVLAQRGDAGPGDRDRLLVALDLARGERHVGPGLQLGDVVAQLADPHLRPRQVAEDRGLVPEPLRRGADRHDRRRVALALGVGEVEPEDVDARLEQTLEDRRVPARGPDRGDDLGPPSRVRLHSHDCRECVCATVKSA